MKDVTIYEPNNRIYTIDPDGRIFSHVVLANGEILLEWGLPTDDVRMDAETIINGVAEESFEDWSRRQIDKLSYLLNEATGRLDRLDGNKEPDWVEAVPMHDPSRSIAIRVSHNERQAILALRNGSARLDYTTEDDADPNDDNRDLITALLMRSIVRHPNTGWNINRREMETWLNKYRISIKRNENNPDYWEIFLNPPV